MSKLTELGSAVVQRLDQASNGDTRSQRVINEFREVIRTLNTPERIEAYKSIDSSLLVEVDLKLVTRDREGQITNAMIGLRDGALGFMVYGRYTTPMTTSFAMYNLSGDQLDCVASNSPKALNAAFEAVLEKVSAALPPRA